MRFRTLTKVTAVLTLSIPLVANTDGPPCKQKIPEISKTIQKRSTWKAFVRWADQKNVPPSNYLDNSIELLRYLCDRIHAKGQSLEQFKLDLRKANRLMILGKKNASPYRGQVDDMKFKEENIGEFRKTSFKVLLSREKYRVPSELIKNASHKEPYFRDKGNLYILLPPSGQIETLLKKAFSYYLKLLKSSKDRSKNLFKFYYHLVRAHPFAKVNNSIFMAYFNLFLIEGGHSPITHQNFDILAFLFSEREFIDHMHSKKVFP